MFVANHLSGKTNRIFVKVAQIKSISIALTLGVSMEKQITMKLPDEMYRDLMTISMKKGKIPIGKLIRIALDDYIRKNKLKGIL